MSGPDAQSLLKTEHVRRQAIVDNDIKTLEHMTADHFYYAHISGLKENREEFFKRLNSGPPVITKTSASDLAVELRKDYALLTGQSFIAMGETMSFETLFLAVWEASEDGWKITAYSSTPLLGATYAWP